MTELVGFQPDRQIQYTQEFELYHNALSLCSMKTRLCLAELGIAYASHHIDLIETGCYENLRPHFRAVNPALTVPVLVHNGHPIYESHEQIRYAARHVHDSSLSLIPDDPVLLAEMNRWVDLGSLTGDPIKEAGRSAGNAVPGQTLPLFATMIEQIPYLRIFEGFLRHFDKRRPLVFSLMKIMGMRSLMTISDLKRAFTKSRQYMRQHLRSLEQQVQLSDGHWIIGDQYTLADVSWLVIFERLRQTDALESLCDYDTYPHCRAYWERSTERPAYKSAILDVSHPLIDYGTQRIREIKATDEATRCFLEGRD